VKWGLWATFWVSDCASTEIPRCIWEDNKIGLKEIGWEFLGWINLA
jgi:hypothetical protein